MTGETIPSADLETVTNRFLRGLPVVREGCWEWQRYRDWKGYGITSTHCKLKKVHRIAWMLYRGPIPKGRLVLHKCNNPACCNPDHLYLGSPLDNMLDCVRSGRHKGASTPGEKHAMAILTVAKVKEIRRRYAAGESQATLGRAFGVSGSTIWGVVHRRSWPHVL